MLYDAKLTIFNSTIEPDSYIYKKNNIGRLIPPPDGFVISRNSEGEVVSRYGDDVFNFSPYATREKMQKRIYFNNWISDSNIKSKTLSQEFKWILFIKIYFYAGGRAGHLSISTLVDYADVLKCLCIYCYKHNNTILQVLSNENLLFGFLNQKNNKIRYLKTISSLLSCLTSLEQGILGVEFNGSNLVKLRDLLNKKRKDEPYNQTPVIPPRIYTQLIKSYHEVVDEFKEVKAPIFNLLQKALADECYARGYSSQKNKGLSARDQKPTFIEAAQNHKLSDFFNQHQITCLKNLSKYLYTIQSACKSLIHVYSGMRDNEVLSLKYKCLVCEKTKTGHILRLLGDTTKLVGIRKSDKWLTSKEVDTPIKILQYIAKLIANYKEFDVEQCPLFVALAYLPFGGHGGFQENDKDIIQCSKGLSNIKLLAPININQEDFDELEKIAPWHDWKSDDKFQIGKPWPITSHQYRRSLIVYAATSGLVSLPSLKRQLKHITMEMTLYYAKGSSRATDLFEDKGHLAHEFQDYQSTADALIYIEQVIFSDEKLFGPHGTWIERNKKIEGNIINIPELREQTIEKVKKGEMAYKETPLGGCTTIEPCNEKPFIAITACIDCSKAVLKLSKVKRVIEVQKEMCNKLDRDSFVFRAEKDQLNDLRRLKSKLEKDL